MKRMQIVFATSLTVICGFFALMSTQALADTPTTGLATTATVTSSATLILTPTNGSTQTLTFTGIAGQTNISPSEGAYTVEAQISTAPGNTPSITVTSSGFTGAVDSAVLAATNLVYYSSVISGHSGGTWNGTSGSPLTAGSNTLANFTGSGDFWGTQTYLLSLPYGTAAETYTGTVTYTVVNF